MKTLIFFFTAVALIVGGALLSDLVVGSNHEGAESLIICGAFILTGLGIEYIVKNT